MYHFVSPTAPLSSDELFRLLSNLESPAVAFSGGLDSALLLLLAAEARHGDVVAMTSLSPSMPARDREDATRFCAERKIPHVFITTKEFQDEKYLANSGDRCYFCKNHLFSSMKEEAERLGRKTLLFGAQADDLDDFRPGHRAAEEHRIRAPFVEAGWGKLEIRAEAARRGLAIAEKPASPCLSSRLVTGTRVSEERLRRIERAEEWLKEKGFRVVRVRDRDGVASVELGEAESRASLDESATLSFLRSLGFREAFIDDRGYRRGSANAAPVQGE